ncbi:MAG: glycoside hydrolase family 43 protein [Verrucomicrobiales bacterium]|nr:glycoside hydrolase family 43 protein [Verrucomicrobiales bacterium]
MIQTRKFPTLRNLSFRATQRFLVWIAWLGVACARAQMPDPPGQLAPGESPKNEAYLFAHMMQGDYWRLYYSVSLDGLHWDLLNGGKRVFEDYRGHADICRGHDGRYYLVGNRGDDQPDINFWVSDDLIHWTKHADFKPDLKTVPEYPKALPRIGAPKLFFDEASSQYVLTWHTTHDLGKTDLPEPYWAGQRTLYSLSKDLRTFSQPPRKLFGWDMATIDVLLRREGDNYFAILKDERYPTLDWPTGKTIRICRSKILLGPYTEPGPPLSPSFREAPTLIPSPNGRAWYLYYEQYPGVSYGLSVAEHLDGPWFQVAGYQRPDWDKYRMPPKVRHGSMRPIRRTEYNALVSAFGKGEASKTAEK